MTLPSRIHPVPCSYLGVELSSDLRWNKQVKKTVAKGNQTLAYCRGILGTVRDQSRTWPTKPSCGLNWNMLLLFGTHSLRTISANQLFNLIDTICTEEGSSICLQQLQANWYISMSRDQIHTKRYHACELHVE